MGQEARKTVRVTDLLHTAGEPGWAAVVDGLLALTVVVWVMVLSVVDPGQPLRVAVPLVLAAAVVWRVFLLVESSQRWQALGLADAPKVEAEQDSHGPAQAA
jgi:hypothetical protein